MTECKGNMDVLLCKDNSSRGGSKMHGAHSLVYCTNSWIALFVEESFGLKKKLFLSLPVCDLRVLYLLLEGSRE